MVKVKQQFFKTAGGTDIDSGRSLSVNCQRVFVTGQIQGNTATDFNGIEHQLYGTRDAFVAGLDHSGKQKFFTHAGRPGSNAGGTSIISNCEETFLTGFIVGQTAINFAGVETNVNTTTSGNCGIFVAGLDNCGKQKFFKTAGDTTNNFNIKIAQNDKRLFVASSLNGSTAIDFCSVEHTLSGGGDDILVAGLDHSGNQKFFATAGGSDNDSISIIANCKGVYVTGFISASNSTDFKGTPIVTKSEFDIFVAGLDNCGKQRFFKHTGTPFDSFNAGVSITESCGKIYVTGFIVSGTATDFDNQPVPTYGLTDIFVAGLDDCTGKQQFFVTAGGQFEDEGVSVTSNKHGIFVTGFIKGSKATNFAGKPVHLSGNDDIFVAGLNKCGTQKFFVTAGSSGSDRGLSITTNDEGIFVTGNIAGPTATDFCGNLIPNLQGEGDIFVAKLDFCGHQQFFLTAGGNQFDQGNQIVVRDNEIYITGFMSGTAGVNFKHCPVTTLKGDRDIFVARLDDLCGQKRSKRSTMPYVPR